MNPSSFSRGTRGPSPTVGTWLLGGLLALPACSAHDSTPSASTGAAAAGSSSGSGVGSAPSGAAAVSGMGSAGTSIGSTTGVAASGSSPSAGATAGEGTDAATGAGASTGAGSGDGGGPEAGGLPVDASAETEVGAPCDTSPGMALEFEGQTPDLVQASIAKLPVGRASRTIELWAYFDGTPSSWVNEHGLFETGNNEGMGGMQCHEFALNSTAWGPGQTLAMLHPYGNCNSVDNFFNLPADTFPPKAKAGWVHISFAYDMAANSFQFTINGNAMLDIGTGAGAAGRTHPESAWPAEPGWTTTSYPTGNLLSIGTTPQFAGPTGWQGKLDELRVWSVFRTAQEIQANMKVMLHGNEPGLVAYYKFDEGMGTLLADATGDATNAAKMLSPTKPQWVTSDIPGPFTCAP